MRISAHEEVLLVKLWKAQRFHSWMNVQLASCRDGVPRERTRIANASITSTGVLASDVF